MENVQIRFLLYIVPFLLHLIGIYLLYCSRSFRRRSPNQYLYVLNLSTIEVIYCLVFVSTNFVDGQYILYLKMFRQSFLYTWFLLIMILLTIDRFLEVYLHIRYLTYCSKRMTKVILCLAPALSVLISVIICVAAKHDMERLFDLYVNQYFCPILNTIFLFAAIFTYGYMLKKIRTYRQKDSITNTNQCNIKNKRFLQRIYTPTFLIISFFWFYLVPDYVNLVYKFYGIIESDKLQDVHYLAHWVSFISDAMIYTLATKQVRNTIRRKLNKRFPYSGSVSQWQDNSSTAV